MNNGSPAELEREAENKRSDVERTLGALKSKMSLGQIVDEVGDYLHADQAQTAALNVGRQVRDNPLALGLIGAGVAWLMFGDGVRARADRFRDDYDDYGVGYIEDRDEYEPLARSRAPVKGGVDQPGSSTGLYGSSTSNVSGTSASNDGESLSDRVKSAAAASRDSVSSASSSVRGSMSSASSSVGDMASSARDRASHLASGAGDRFSSAYDRTRARAHDLGDAGRRARRAAGHYGRRAENAFLDALQNEPLVVGAFAVAVGAAIGAALPATRREDEWLGETRDHLAEDAMQYAREVKDDALDVAEKTYRSASDKASEEGLTGTKSDKTMAEKVENVAKTAADTAKTEANKHV